MAREATSAAVLTIRLAVAVELPLAADASAARAREIVNAITDHVDELPHVYTGWTKALGWTEARDDEASPL